MFVKEKIIKAEEAQLSAKSVAILEQTEEDLKNSWNGDSKNAGSETETRNWKVDLSITKS